MKSPLHSLLVALIPLIGASCASTTAYRRENQLITVHRKGIGTMPENYWIIGSRPDAINATEDLRIHAMRPDKTNFPLKCTGFVDTSHEGCIDIRLAQQQGSMWQAFPLNGRHKLVDTTKPRPFYRWLIP